jgi:VWFA-related protein
MLPWSLYKVTGVHRSARQFWMFHAAIFFLAWGTIASAQQTAVPSATIKVEVRQVLVPVVVTDKKGHHVTGLRARDFQVLEDGVAQRVVGFSTEAEGAAQLFQPEPAAAGPPSALPSPKPPVEANPAPRRTYLLCVDTLNSAFTNFSSVRSALQSLFKQERSSDSQYAIVALGRQPLIVQNLTRDPAAVLAAINSKGLTRAIQQSESTNLAQQERELTTMLADYCQRCSCAGTALPSSRTSGGTDQVCMGKWARIEMWAGAAAQERTALLRSFLRDLRALVEQVARQPGKRTLVFVSDGFNLRPGRDLFGIMAAYSRDQGTLLKNPGDYMGPEMHEIVRLATARDVTFYTLDSRGLYTPMGAGFDASEEPQITRLIVLLPEIQQQKETMALENQDALAELAAATGGVFVRNTNDLAQGMRQALADGREYYLLAYVPSNTAADGKFREIKVEVREKNLLVRAKRGYWAPTK